MCDLLLTLKTVYFIGNVDENTPFAVGDNIEDVMRPLKEIGENLIIWFSNNQMNLNPDKCHLLLNT